MTSSQKPISILTSVDDCQGFVLNAADSLHVIYAFASYHPACVENGQIDTVLESLISLNSNVMFAKFNAEESVELSEVFDIASVPTFLFMVGKEIVDVLEGVDIIGLKSRIEKLKAPSKSSSSVSNAATTSKSKLDFQGLETRIRALINASPVMVFMKGSPSSPKCKFSRRLVEILQENNVKFSSFDILTSEAVRQGLKSIANWQTYPQVWVNGEFVGGVDIVQEMKENGEFKSIFPMNESIPLPMTNVSPSTNAAETLSKTTSVQPIEHSSSSSSSSNSLEERLRKIITSTPVVLLMKGTPDEPRCGFSAKTVQLLKEHGIQFSSYDILLDAEAREGFKKLNDWPTYPQLIVNGSLVGGLDILQEMVQSDPTPLSVQLGVSATAASQENAQVETDTSLLTPEIKCKLLTTYATVVLFMKGTPDDPQCGFSQRAVDILGNFHELNVLHAESAKAVSISSPKKPKFAYFNILQDEEIRQALKVYSDWPTYPQVYCHGQLIGGVDILQEYVDSGELLELLS
jgi:Grx4 family monothiol glutaredoxin